MKICKRCNKSEPEVFFTPAKSRHDGKQAYCSECMKKYRREHYHNNKQQYYDRNAKTKQKIRDYVNEIKSQPCKDCGLEYHPFQMDFDHLEEFEKEIDISKLVGYGSLRRIKEEISKCEVVCSNCHRLRTLYRLELKLAGESPKLAVVGSDT